MAAQRPPCHVLVVEDDDAVREVLTDLLDASGYAVNRAANGREALDQLRSGLLPCLILLDLMMPVMDGFEFREQQLSNPRWAAIPVVVLTALIDAARAAATLGAVTVIAKPFNIGELLAIAQQHCR